MIQDIYYQVDLNRYDLDKDGFFGGEEITPDQQEAMLKLSSDTSRNFSIITSVFSSAIITVPVLIVGLIIDRRKKFNTKRYIE